MTTTLRLLAAGALLAGLLPAHAVAQQRMTQPMPSPRASVSQTIGITQVSVEYSRPGVKGREIFGNPQIVPYDSGQPWRAGADENTVVEFEHDVTVEGQPLAAGRYGVHIFPKSSGPWTVAFSKDNASWGSYTYDASRDALRVEVTPMEAPQREWLQYEFRDLGTHGATLVMHWDETALPVKLGVDTTALMVEYLNTDYVRGYGFWQAPQLLAAASWCDRNDVNLENAEAWAARATASAPDANGLSTLASIQAKLGKTTEAEETRKRAAELSPEAEG